MGLRSIGMEPCTTPVRSLQSNGMAEAFVKTFKRDYVSVNHPGRQNGYRPTAVVVRALQYASPPQSFVISVTARVLKPSNRNLILPGFYGATLHATTSLSASAESDHRQFLRTYFHIRAPVLVKSSH